MDGFKDLRKPIPEYRKMTVRSQRGKTRKREKWVQWIKRIWDTAHLTKVNPATDLGVPPEHWEQQKSPTPEAHKGVKSTGEASQK